LSAHPFETSAAPLGVELKLKFQARFAMQELNCGARSAGSKLKVMRARAVED
jgi:hypothetical protein